MYKRLGFLLCAWMACVHLASADQIATNPEEARIENKEEQTLSIIKPDAVSGNHIGEIITLFEKAGLRIGALKVVQLTKKQAEEFYAVHKDRPFYADLVNYMSSGPVVVMVLKGPDAIAKNRILMGSTDPQKAAAGTIRAQFGQSVQRNAVHGSDGKETAKTEINFFFPDPKLIVR